MKLFEISNKNEYYRVEKEITVWALVGYKPSNHYYGSARLHKPEYKKLTLEVDDEIHDLVGGTFAVQVYNEAPPEDDQKHTANAKVHQIQIDKPEDDFSPFEKRSAAPQNWSSLLSSGSIVKIKPNEAEKVKYR
jgi:hypothetical protein